MRKRYLLGALALIACLIVGGSVAYFSAQDSGENAFAMGKVKIELSEDGWNPDEDHIIDKGAVFQKAPKVKNAGNVNCYARINVKVSDYDILKFAVQKDDEPDTDFEPNQLFSDLDAENWKSYGEPIYEKDEDDNILSVTYRYVTKKELTPGETSSHLFKAIKFPDNMTGDISDIGDDFVVSVSADAIQSETYKSADEAFEAYDKL